ncbi:MAG: hypothetical protein WD042_00090 [Phycisphaeraceae bacterium]
MGIKLLFTAFAIVVGIAICLIDPKADNAGPGWIWRLGRYDPIRNIICRPDGALRRYTKVGILLWFAVFLAMIWLIAP